MIGQLRLILIHTRWMMLDLLRQPTYVVSTISFPVLFYVIFAVPESKEMTSANYLMASFSGFAVFGVVFLQFGVGLAQERTQTWHRFLRTLPVRASGFLAARFLTAILFSLMATAAIVAVALMATPATLTVVVWTKFILVLLLGGLTFCCMGLALGYWASEKASLPLGNLIYLPLSFLGGLWKPPEILPESLKGFSEHLPTRHYGNLLWSVVQEKPMSEKSFLWLFIFAGLFLLIAILGYRRELDKKRGSL